MLPVDCEVFLAAPSVTEGRYARGVSGSFHCPSCKQDHAVRELLAGAEPMGTLGVLVSEVGDGCRNEFVVRGGSVWLGYVYAAGAPHFCPMVEVKVPGLSVESYEPLRLSIDGEIV